MTRYLSDNLADYPEGIVLPIDKPYRWTSADVIRKLKFAAARHFGIRKIKLGHAGTLDPLATGILLVCVGPATRRAEELQASRKQYVAEFSFGATTPSYDLEKEIDRRFPTEAVTREAVEALLPSFTGEQMQVAPLFSAKSVDGVRAYETARRLYREGRLEEGSELISARPITVYSIRLEDFYIKKFEAPAPDPSPGRIKVADLSGIELPTARLRIDCSKGTYIRSLARDMGEALGTGAFMSSLRRTANGGFDISEALTLEEALEMLR